MAGCAVAMAKYNGLYKVSHIQDKLADIAAYVETLRALANAAAQDPVMYGDIAVPNPLICNMANSILPANTIISWSWFRISVAVSWQRRPIKKIGRTRTSTITWTIIWADRKNTALWIDS